MQFRAIRRAANVAPQRFIGQSRGMASFAADKQAGVVGLRSAMSTPADTAQLLTDAASPSSDPALKCRVLDLDVVSPHAPAQFLAGALRFPSDFHPSLKRGPDGMHVISVEEAIALTNDLGLAPAAPVLLADSMACIPAARTWWLLRACGFHGAAVLQGSKQNVWLEQGTHLMADSARDASAEELQAADAAHGAAPSALSADWLALLPEVQAAASGNSNTPCTILDVRSEGDAWPAAPYFKSPAQVKALLAKRDFPEPGEAGRVIVTCQSGMRAAVPLPALYDLGYDVALYDGSMAEYSRDVHSKVVQ